MIIVLDEKNKADLAFLQQLPPNIVEEFCRISLELIRKGNVNRAIFKNAAEKLKLRLDLVEHGVEGLANLFLEASRLTLNELDFIDSLLVLSFPEELNAKLKDFFLANRVEIRIILSDLSFTLPHYKDLDWRLDVQIASRAMRHQVTPVYVLRLDTLTPEPQSIHLQSDVAGIRHLARELEAALQEGRTAHVNRILRNVK